MAEVLAGPSECMLLHVDLHLLLSSFSEDGGHSWGTLLSNADNNIAWYTPIMYATNHSVLHVYIPKITNHTKMTLFRLLTH